MYEFIEMMDDNDDDVSSVLPYSSRKKDQERRCHNQSERSQPDGRTTCLGSGGAQNQRPLLIFGMCTDHPNTDRLTMRGVRGPGVSAVPKSFTPLNPITNMLSVQYR